MAETDVPEPRTDYGVTKAAATLLCQAEFFRGRPVTTVRIFSAYGPWEEPGRLVPYVMDCCGRGVTPRVTAGAQPRDFVYVRDVVDLFRLAAADPVRCGPIVHAGTGRQSTVREMIETIIDVCGNGVKVEFGAEPPRPDEPKCWVASVEGTRARTGWAPRHDLRAGVRAMWEWYQNTAPAARAA
jgi:nucleoside-diphosphate-sugar epimerase